MALIAARESRQGDSRVIEATSAWVRFCAARVALRKLPMASWADSSRRADVLREVAAFLGAFLVVFVVDLRTDLARLLRRVVADRSTKA